MSRTSPICCPADCRVGTGRRRVAAGLGRSTRPFSCADWRSHLGERTHHGRGPGHGPRLGSPSIPAQGSCGHLDGGGIHQPGVSEQHGGGGCPLDGSRRRSAQLEPPFRAATGPGAAGAGGGLGLRSGRRLCTGLPGSPHPIGWVPSDALDPRASHHSSGSMMGQVFPRPRSAWAGFSGVFPGPGSWRREDPGPSVENQNQWASVA